MIKKILLFSVLSITHATLWADKITHSDTITVEVYYRQGHSRLDPAYWDNHSRLDSLVKVLHKLSSDSTFRLERFGIVSGASPEGSTSLNKVLSEKRTNRISDYLRHRIHPRQASLMEESHVGIDWDKLQKLVAQSDMPYKEEVLEILVNTPEWILKNGKVVDSRKRQLMLLHKGSCWHYMEEKFFPELRHSCVRLEYSSLLESPVAEKAAELDYTEKEKQDSLSVFAEEVDCQEDSSLMPVAVMEPVPSCPFYMALKTNLLYDALLVPNIGVEFYLGKGFSVGGDWMYAWWRNNNHHRYWRMYGGELAVRKYFHQLEGKSPFSGHHVGVYGQIFTYDFETGGKGYMGGKPGGTLWEKMNYVAGLEYGYSLPVTRRLNLDFVIGLGYWGGTYYEYLPQDDHYVWQRTKQRNWFGPTKAEISLVWLLGRENYNTKKGGK